MNPNLEIAITSRVLNLILERSWKDYDNFSSSISCEIIKKAPHSKDALIKVIESFQSPSFYDLNKISVNTFVKIFPKEEILSSLSKYAQAEPLTFVDVFPETSSISVAEGKQAIKSLSNLAEDKIQETLVDSLREKNATNCRSRSKDTVLEVSDLEHFLLYVKNTPLTFAGVVKGYKSIGHKSITWEDISHQVTKAYNRTNPDHVLLVLAKNPADSVTSELVQYSKSVKNPNLIILCDPLEIARFLRARGII